MNEGNLERLVRTSLMEKLLAVHKQDASFTLRICILVDSNLMVIIDAAAVETK